MLESMSIHQQLGPSELFLATYRTKNRWEFRTREQATKALRDFVGKQSLIPREYALHSGGMEGATKLAASGLQAWAIQREGRWKSDEVMMYV